MQSNQSNVLDVPDVDFYQPHVESLFSLCFIAAWICVVVSVILVVYSLCVSYLSIYIYIYICVCVLVNCLWNVFIICVSEVNVFAFLKVVLFLGGASFC